MKSEPERESDTSKKSKDNEYYDMRNRVHVSDLKPGNTVLLKNKNLSCEFDSTKCRIINVWKHSYS